MVPPVDLVARAVHYLHLQMARATIVVPLRPSSSFWPLIANKCKQLIKGYLVRNGAEALRQERNLNSFLELSSCRVGQVGGPNPDMLCSSVFVLHLLVQLSDYFLSRVLL